MDPIYQRLSAERLFEPDPPRGVEDPQQVPVVHPTSEHGGTVSYAGHTDHQLPAPADPGLLPRIDGWCENRAPHHLSDHDGRE